MIRLFSRSILASFIAFPLVLSAQNQPAPTQSKTTESCSTVQDMDAGTRAALEGAAQQYFAAASTGNTAALQQSAIAPVAGNFQGIASAVTRDKDKIAGGKPEIRNEWLLDAPGTQTYERAEFFCGTFNSPQHTTFEIPNLPPGKYAVAIQDVNGTKQPFVITYVLQQESGQWKLAGYQAKPRQVGPHDGLWYWVQARDMKKQGEQHTSFFYYTIAADLLAPVPFMSTPQLEALYSEEQADLPKDLPQNPQQPAPATLNGQTYNIIQAFVVPDDKQGLDLVYKYSSADVSDQLKAYQQNVAFIKALTQQYPEYKKAFTMIVARAVAPNGQDFPTPMPVSDIK